jgi:hypothetical protein
MKSTFGATLLIFLLISVLLTNAREEKNRQRHIRTDGFYLYDNGVDTILTIPGGREMQLAMYESMKEQGYIEKEWQPKTALDSEAKLDGGTDIRFFFFLSDTSAGVFGTIYRHRPVIQSLLDYYHYKKDEKDTLSERISSINAVHEMVFLTDSTFAYKEGSDYFEQTDSCLIKGDSLFVSSTRTISKYMKLPVLHKYVFVPFNNIPPDLLQVKK